MMFVSGKRLLILNEVRNILFEFDTLSQFRFTCTVAVHPWNRTAWLLMYTVRCRIFQSDFGFTKSYFSIIICWRHDSIGKLSWGNILYSGFQKYRKYFADLVKVVSLPTVNLTVSSRLLEVEWWFFSKRRDYCL